MSGPPFLDASAVDVPDWRGYVAALEQGHKRPRAEIADVFLGPEQRTLLSRAAHIEGLGFGVKSVTVVPGNTALGLATIHGAMLLFEDGTGNHVATLDSALITNLKTVSDSLLGARLLARKDSRRLLVVGAGTVAATLLKAYPIFFPDLERIEIWNRTTASAEALARETDAAVPVNAVTDLEAAVGAADIVATATMAKAPVVKGAWLKPGTHLDLVGAFRADMREVDDAALLRSRIFVDSRDATVEHIGELKIPISTGVISVGDICGDLYDLVGGAEGRLSDEDITIFKNGGGAHLDLMVGFAIVDGARQAT